MRTASILCRLAGALGQFKLDVAFDAPAKGVTALFGPSGCGKTSVLRAVAGLQRFAHGEVRIGDAVWQAQDTFQPAWRRPIGYVFQEASLFAHLSVRGNLLYGAPHTGSRVVAFDEIVSLLGLERLIDRHPRHLSGGERQRVAIGRALLSEPRLLLMDEPLAALDRAARDEILPFLDRLHGDLSIPILYVTHDIAEVERLADHIVLMREGRVVGSGPVAQVQADPSLPLARAREASVSLAARVESHDPAYGLSRLEVRGGHLFLPSGPLSIGEMRRIRIGASDVSLALTRHEGSSILNILPARIEVAEPLETNEMIVVLRLGETGEGERLLARVTHRSWDLLALAPGKPVFAQIKGVSMSLKGRCMPRREHAHRHDGDLTDGGENRALQNSPFFGYANL